MDALVEPGLGQVDEVRGSDRHPVQENFRLEGASSCLEGGHRIGARCRGTDPAPLDLLAGRWQRPRPQVAVEGMRHTKAGHLTTAAF